MYISFAFFQLENDLRMIETFLALVFILMMCNNNYNSNNNDNNNDNDNNPKKSDIE